jgi:hypothetical protein
MRERFNSDQHQQIGRSIAELNFNLKQLERKLLGGLPPAHNIMVDIRASLKRLNIARTKLERMYSKSYPGTWKRRTYSKLVDVGKALGEEPEEEVQAMKF